MKDLLVAAKAARENSHSPYSGIKVGAALRTVDGKVFSGCNVENSSYGATVCAERTAIQTAVAAVGKLQIKEILVVTDATPPWPPCGLCRQVITEFGNNVTIHAANLQGEILTSKMDEIFSNPFTPAKLNATTN